MTKRKSNAKIGAAARAVTQAVIILSLALISSFLAAARPAEATTAATFDWTEKAPNVSPPPLAGSAMTYDPAIGETVLFGGTDGFNDGTGGSDDTWGWNGSTWSIIATTGPTPRAFMQMTYDAKSRSVVLFGGEGEDGSAGCESCADTWTFNGAWTLQDPTTSPPSDFGYSMAYDPTIGKVVLAGGAGDPAHTWLWNGETWNRRSSAPFGSTVKLNTGATMTYDPSLKAVLYVGGISQTRKGSFLSDFETWEWAGTSWTELFPATSPPARRLFGASYDTTAGGIVIFGGQLTTGSQAATGDTWLFDGTSWYQINTRFSPVARLEFSMAPAFRNGPPMVFGGFGGERPLARHDTWILDRK
jgi:hypothetical protein